MNWHLTVILFLALSFSDIDATKRPRIKRAPVARFDYVVDPLNRTLCQPGEPAPPNRVDTASRVTALRTEMVRETLEAYLIPLEDEHGSEGAAHDARVKYISGFSGSNGHAWVTPTKQALWTDGRYFLQADQQMDCNWILMKEGQAGYPTAEQWLLQEIPANSQVGADSRLIGISTWQSYETALQAKNITLVEVADLIDIIWTTDRPERVNNEIYEHTVNYTGETWQEKIALIRDELAAAGADLYVLTALDETAWTFNLRGSDMEESPLFYSYGIVTDTEVRLYLTNYSALLPPVQTHLNTRDDGSCAGQTGLCVHVQEYDQIFTDLAALATTKQKLWVDPFSSYRTYSVAGDHRYVDYSPIQLMKSIKTDTERRKYKECQIRDSAALVEFMTRLEQEIADGVEWTELKVSNELAALRSTYQDNKGTSFTTIAGFGPNGAVIHYRPLPETDTRITTDNLFLLDSGGQYLDGTTDVTRTFHFGTPTQEHIDAYTMVLTSVIDLAMAVWPEGTYGRDIDVFARNPLWQRGLDYNHGTGHGIAYFINVHEGPGRINQGYNPAHQPLYEGMFFSDEPGWYKDGYYGIRLETIVGVEKANTANNFNGKQYLTFVPVTYVPFEPKLIRTDWLNDKQLAWLDNYHAKCMEKTAAYLRDNRPEIADKAIAWMQARTSPLSSVSSARAVTPVLWSVIVALAVTFVRHL